MDIVKALLLERGMSVKEFAEKAGLSRRSLDPYIRGTAKWENARGSMLLKVADTLGIDPHVLVNGRVEINITE